MNMLLCMTGRNLKIFLKDKANIFFSLLTTFIVLGLYILFLGKTQTDSINAALAEVGFSGAEKEVRAFCDSWMLSGALASATITVPLCACGVMVQDKKRGIVNDLAASPVPKWLAPASYCLSVAAAGLILCSVVFVLALGWLALSGSWCLTAADVFGALGSMVLSVLCSTALLVFAVGFIRTDGAFTGLNVILGTVVGFLIGAYMPLSMLPKGIQYFSACIPGSHTAGLMRNFIMGGALDKLESVSSAEFAAGLREQFSFELYFFGNAVTPAAMAVFIAVAALLFIGVLALQGFIVRGGAKKKKRRKL